MTVWFLAARPKTLLASISPVLLGLGMAYYDGFSNILLSGLILLDAVLIQVITNYINDYYDFKKGADTEERVGPTRMLQSGNIQPASMAKVIIFLVILCLALGGWIVYETNYVILVIGILSLIFAYAYTGGPYPLAYHALGEIFVFLFFGVVAVVGSYYAQSTCCFNFQAGEKMFIISMGPGFLSTLILMANNIRDYESDRKHNKNTLVVKFGIPISKIIYTIIVILVTSVPFLLIPYLGEASLFSLAVLPLLINSTIKIYRYQKPEELNQVLALNSLTLFFFCLLLVSAKAIG